MLAACIATALVSALMGALVARWYYKRRKNQPRTAGGKFTSRYPNKQKERQPFAIVPPVDREEVEGLKKAVRQAENRMFERANEIHQAVLEKKRESQ